MNWETHLKIETALLTLQHTDTTLHDIVAFMAETAITFDEFVSLREPWTRAIYAGRLEVNGRQGHRSVPMTDAAWSPLITVAIPDWHHLGNLRLRWLDALAPFGLRISFKDCVAWLAIVREADRCGPMRDDEVPF